MSSFVLEDTIYLLSDDTKYLYFNSIEFIKTTPSSRLYETTKHSSNIFIIKTFWAIENQYEFSHTFSEIFNGFGFSSTCRTLRSSSFMKFHSHG